MSAKRARSARAPAGQHFLRSTALARELVDDARVAAGDVAVDVGAGTGVLTAALAGTAARVLAVEADPVLAAGLRTRFAGRGGVEVVRCDARRLEWPAEPFKVVSNLPFAGATAILRRLLDDPGLLLERAELVLQWEVAAKRAAVWPGTLLGVLWGARYELALVRRLPPSVFAPPPSVHAGVLRVVRRVEPLVPAGEWPAYVRLLEHAFASGAPLRRLLPPRTLKRLALDLGFSPAARARDLDARQWAAVHAAVRRSGYSPVDTNPFKPVQRGRKGVG